jgi:hypothetical protein
MNIRTLALTLILTPLLTAQNFAGEYSASMPEVASGLLLKSDNTFAYFFTYGAADYTSKGTWRSDKESVYLTTSMPEQKPFRQVRSAKGTTGVYRIHVVAAKGQGVAHMDVTLSTPSGPVKERTGQDGVAEFLINTAAKSVSLHVPVYDVDGGTFELTEGAYEIWYEINGDAITTLRFKDERLKLTNGALELMYFKGDKPLRYRKQ